MKYDFIAIDFETANENYCSACSLGLVFVKDKQIVETKHFLIKPPGLEFNETNINIHGITPDDVRDAPTFPKIWEQIKDYFVDNMIIAHNAVFDMSVLKNCLIEYNLPIPDFKYLCSIPISTRACRGKNVGRSLKDRTSYFGIELKDHHNALSDAIACAELVIKCVEIKKRKSFESYCNVHCSLPIKNFVDLQPRTSFKKQSRKKYPDYKVSTKEIAATVEVFDETHPFYGKSIVFTGELTSMSRKEAMQEVVDLGGIIKSAISSKTDFLIVGTQDTSFVGKKGLSSKELKAYELRDSGHHILIIDEDEFIDML